MIYYSGKGKNYLGLILTTAKFTDFLNYLFMNLPSKSLSFVDIRNI